MSDDLIPKDPMVLGFQGADDPDKVTPASRIGAVSDTAWTSGDGTMIAVLKKIAGGGASNTVSGPLGRQADAASVSVAMSTEDVAFLNALLTTSAFPGTHPGQWTGSNGSQCASGNRQ